MNQPGQSGNNKFSHETAEALFIKQTFAFARKELFPARDPVEHEPRRVII